MPALTRPGGHSPPGAEGHGAGVRALGWACTERGHTQASEAATGAEQQ